jgi:two-component system chemotaxis sensor kinase CheA
MNLDGMAEAFFEEANELLADFESGLLNLENSPDDTELLNRIFRCAHTLKGNSAMLGFDAVSHFTHALEDLLDKLRKTELEVDGLVIDVLLQSLDIVKELVGEAKGQSEVDGERLNEVLASIRGMVKGERPAAEEPARREQQRSEPQSEEPASAEAPASVEASETLYEIRFEPPSDVFTRGLDPLKCLEGLSTLGQFVQITTESGALPPIDELDPERSYLAWTIWLLSRNSEETIRECFEFVADADAVTIQGLSSDGDEPASASSADSGEREEQLEDEKRLAAQKGMHAGAEKKPAATQQESGSIRVATEKVDKLVNLVGEIVIVQSMIHQVVTDFSPEKLYRLQEALTDMERNTRELQERVMAVRMLPIGNIFSRFPRLVRDLANTFNKNITLQIIGEDTELDKGVIERIGDPLTHLIRNAVDHGMDTPEERRHAGKPQQGTVRLQAFHQGGNVIIEVADDGRGLNTQKIRQKAIEQGLISATDALSDEQVHMLIFQAGFSTAAVITDVSGRGVGMDVVRKNVEALKGTITIHSETGKGTTFRIKLPLTLAILDGLTLQVGEQIFIVPLTSIVESIRPLRENVKTVLGKGEIVVVRGQFLPLLRLHRLFDVAGRTIDPTQALVVILENDGDQAALMVDELVGQQQVVIKSLESHYQKVEGVAGATIMGDGRVALILDVPELVQMSQRVNLPTAA